MPASNNTVRSEFPQAVIHKQILDAAAANPDSSTAELAAQVSSATVDLVERVLEEYGDPGQQSDGTPESSSHAQPPATATELTEKQRETVRLIYEHPTASQRELAAMLNVSHVAVHNRIRSIDGFEWDDRWAFVRELFGCPAESCRAIDQLAAVADQEGPRSEHSTSSVFEDPSLTQKIIRVCVEAESITDDEFQMIVADFLDRIADSSPTEPASRVQ